MGGGIGVEYAICLAIDLEALQAEAKAAGFVIDLNQAMAKALRRLVKTAEVELQRANLNHPNQQEKPDDVVI